MEEEEERKSERRELLDGVLDVMCEERVKAKNPFGFWTELSEYWGHLLKSKGFFDRGQVSLGQVQFDMHIRHLRGDVNLAL